MELSRVPCDVVNNWAVELMSRRGEVDMEAAIDAFKEYVEELPEPDVVVED